MKDNPYSALIKIMREQGAKYNPPSIQIGQVISPPPNIIIKIGDLQVDKDNILIADYLLPNYKRHITIPTVDKASGSLQGEISGASVRDHEPHMHNVTKIGLQDRDATITIHADSGTFTTADGQKALTQFDIISQSTITMPTGTADGEVSSVTLSSHGIHSHELTSLGISNASMLWEDTLNAGDIVAVMPTEDRQTYIILARLVRLNG